MNFVIEKLNNAKRTKSDMKKLAEELSDLKVEQYNELIENLISNYENPALNKLLIVSAINAIKLDPVLLAKSFNIADELIDVYFPYKFQDASAIPPILEISKSLIMANPEIFLTPMYIAIELALKYEAYRQEIYDTLIMLMHRLINTEFESEINNMVKVFNETKYDNSDIKWKTKFKPLNKIPEREENVSYGKRFDGQISDKPWELGKMDSKKLTKKELLVKFEYAITFGMLDKAYDFLVELQKKSKSKKKFTEAASYLYVVALLGKNVDMINKVKNFLPEDFHSSSEEIILKCIDHSDFMDLLENLSEIALKAQDALSVEDFLLDFQSFTNFYYPAFSIILARSAIATYQGNIEDIDDFINQLKCNRVCIGLKPDGDPIEDVLSALSAQEKLKDAEENIAICNTKINDLILTNSKYHADIRKKKKEIEKLEKEIARLKDKLKGIPDYQKLKKDHGEMALELEKYKLDLKNCKIMINEEKEKNRALSKDIESEKEVIMPVIEIAKEPIADETTNFIMPEYKKAFVDGLNRLDSTIAIKAVTAVTAFAMRDEKTLTETVELEGLTGYYRIKFDDSYRIIVHWKPGKSITILDVISRQDLEKWIKNKK